MGDVFDRMAQSQPNQSVARPLPEIPEPVMNVATDQRGMVGDTPVTLHGVSPEELKAATTAPGGDVFDRMAQQSAVTASTSTTKMTGAGSNTDWNNEKTPSKIWQDVSEPLIPQGHLNKALKEYATSAPTKFSEKHPYAAAAAKGLAGTVSDTMEFARGLTSPLAIATLGLGELGQIPGAVGKIAKAGGALAGVGFGAQGVGQVASGVEQIQKEGLTPETIQETLGGAGQALLATSPLRGEPTPEGRTSLRPAVEETAGVEAPIAALQQENPDVFTRMAAKVATPGKATEFQEKYTKPAAKRQAISTLSQVATDKIAAHEALVNGEAAPEEITGTQTAGEHITPDEIWPDMQRTAGKTWQKAREASDRDMSAWQERKTAAEESHKASVEHYNDLVDAHNADPANADNPIERQVYDPAEADVPEKPKTYDGLKADLDAAESRLGKNNPTDVREKAKQTDVPKAEKALDKFFQDHEEQVPKAEYDSAQQLWADSMRFKEIATNLRSKLVKGTLTGNDIRGLEAVVDNKAVTRRGAAGLGEFNRLVGPEAKANLKNIARLFDPLEKTDPRSGVIASWGKYIVKHALTTIFYPVLGIGALGVEGANIALEFFMNHVMFDPEFGSMFGKLADATKAAFSAGTQVPVEIAGKFRDMVLGLAEKYKASRLGGEEGAVSLGGVKKARTGESPFDTHKNDNQHIEQAKQENPEGTASDWLKRAQELKDAAKAPDTSVIGPRIAKPRTPGEPLEHGFDMRSAEDLGNAAREANEKEQGPLPRGERRKLERTPQEQETQKLFGQARQELGDDATSDQIMARVEELRGGVAAGADAYNKAEGRAPIKHEALEPDARRAEIADAFDEMKHDPNDPKVKASYAALKDEVAKQWDYATKKMGITIEPSDTDPYHSEQELFDDVKNNKHLGVWRGGNPLEKGHPLAEVDSKTGENYNTMLRAVHDLFGHVAAENKFGEAGEESAWNLHKQMFSKEAMPAMTTETRGQTSWFFNNKGVRGGEPLGQFATQKAGLLPEDMNERTNFHDTVSSDELAKYHNKNRGFTLNGREGFMKDQPGYSVAGEHPELEQVLPGQNISTKALEEYRNRPEVKEVLKNPNNSLGAWFHKGNTHLEVSKLMQDRNAAIAEGQRLNQNEIYDHAAKEGIPTGGNAGDVAAAAAAPDFSGSEITTRRPTSVKGDLGNKPNQHANMDAVEQASRKVPSGKTAMGKAKMGYKEKLARTVADYTGIDYTDEELKNPDTVLRKFVNRAADNLEWLYNQVPEEIRGRTRQWYDAANSVVGNMAGSYGFTPEQGAGVTAVLSPQNPWDNNLGMAKRTMDIYRNRQNFPYSPDMEKMAAELKKVPTQTKAFKGLLKDISGKKLSEVTNSDSDVQAVQRALWIRLYDEAHGSPLNDQYAPTGEVVGHSPDTKSWIGLDHVGKAVKILEDGSITNINDVMGQGHKVRNFYNNLINPNSKAGHVTIDTHATAAAHLQPFGANELEAKHNFGGTLKGTPGPPSESSTGIQGTYPLYAEAYQRVARKLGILPRELQSVTWEAIKALMGDEKKTPELKARVKEIWQDVQDGKLTPAKARDSIKNAANGFSKPAWMSDEEWEKLGAEGDDTSFEGGE